MAVLIHFCYYSIQLVLEIDNEITVVYTEPMNIVFSRPLIGYSRFAKRLKRTFARVITSLVYTKTIIQLSVGKQRWLFTLPRNIHRYHLLFGE